ncbi:hypothetical protein QOT17_011006 [Balamuthia mandrillaris]
MENFRRTSQRALRRTGSQSRSIGCMVRQKSEEALRSLREATAVFSLNNSGHLILNNTRTGRTRAAPRTICYQQPLSMIIAQEELLCFEEDNNCTPTVIGDTIIRNSSEQAPTAASPTIRRRGRQSVRSRRTPAVFKGFYRRLTRRKNSTE